MSSPCNLCAEALERAPFQIIIFTTNNDQFEIVSNKNISKNHISSGQREKKNKMNEIY
jgi:tRNA(Arg) A34 adenosine deaminase TadA